MEATQVTTSIDALTKELEIVTHNIANANTAGFKRRCNAFTKALDAQKGGPETYSPGQIDLKMGFDFSQGHLIQTGNPLDIAILGGGFFVIETQDGPLYTRNGAFGTDKQGQLVDSLGRTVAGEAGPITIPPGAGVSQLAISSDGQVSAGGINVGKLRVVDFKDNQGKLVPAGGNCYLMPDKDVMASPAEKVVVKQGYQEASNVKVVDELVDMIMITRLYEANMKYVSAQKDNTGSLMNVAMG